MGVASLGYIGIETARLDEWIVFATEVLGLAIGPSTIPDDTVLRMDDRAARFVLEAGETERLAYVGWEVATSADLDGLAGRLTAAGFPARPGTKGNCARRRVDALVHTTDPAGYELELFVGPAPRPARSSRREPSAGSAPGTSGWVISW